MLNYSVCFHVRRYPSAIPLIISTYFILTFSPFRYNRSYIINLKLTVKPLLFRSSAVV